jgi:hypothetical protein
MENHNSDKDFRRKITIQTQQEEVEINWSQNQRPGFCPHCHKCIPLSSIVFKKENGNETQTYSGMEAVMEKKFGIPKGQNPNKIGECPYCHQAIPVREVIFKKTEEDEG